MVWVVNKTGYGPEDGQTYNILNYAADESWGPKMDGTMYRPWWSWIHRLYRRWG